MVVLFQLWVVCKEIIVHTDECHAPSDAKEEQQDFRNASSSMCITVATDTPLGDVQLEENKLNIIS